MANEEETFSLDEISKASRLDKYLHELPKVIGRRKKALSFLRNVFLECYHYISMNRSVVLPRISLRFAPTQDQFEKAYQRESKGAISREKERKLGALNAFVVGTKLSKRIYTNLKALTELLQHNNLSFVMNLVEIYIHEILHIGLP